MNIKRTFRRVSFLLSRLLGNMGVESATPILERVHSPVAATSEKRWLAGLYLDRPKKWTTRTGSFAGDDSVLVPTLRVGTLGSNR